MYTLNPEQQDTVALARSVAATSLAPYAASVDEEGRFPREAIAALGDAGLLGLNVPVEFGGQGAGLGTAVAVVDELAQQCASTAMIYLMHLCGVACYNAAPDAAGAALRAAARGEHLATLAWSERGSRSHFWAPVSQASAHNGTVTLDAQKSWVTSAGNADGYVVSTRSPHAVTATDTTLYLVQKGDAGLAIDGPWRAMGLRGNGSAPMTLSGVTIPAARALSAEGAGFDTMIGVVLPWFQLGNAAISVGLAEAAVQATTDHLTGRRFEYSGTTLAELPNLRARLAMMRIETDRARAHLAAAVNAAEAGAPNGLLLVLQSKAAASESALLVTDLGMRNCGGAAFSKHLGLERLFRDARAAGVMAPTTDVLLDFIGRALCGMELFA